MVSLFKQGHRKMITLHIFENLRIDPITVAALIAIAEMIRRQWRGQS